MVHTRREFLKGSLAGAAAVASASFAGASRANQAPVPEKWDETVDVLIIGSGFAGLAAAIEAKKAGVKNVVVLEKMGRLGGNSAINGGILTATGCPQQAMHGIKDSKELLIKDILVAGNYMNDPKKVKVLADEALPTYEWCLNEIKAQFIPDAIGQEGGHSVPRYVTTTNGVGSGIVEPEIARCKELGVDLRLHVYVKHIIRDAAGVVQGVEVLDGYRFPKLDTGTQKFIKAEKAVCLCYGGFSADVKYRMYQDPKLDGSLDCTNQPGATSELWRDTSAIGCLQVQNDWIQCGPWGCPREKGMGIGWMFNQTAAAEYGIWINSKAQRFVNELANRKVRADAIMVEQQKGLKCFGICNEPNTKPLQVQRPQFWPELFKLNLVEKYNTIEEMCKPYGIPVDDLKAVIEKFNGYVKAKSDPDWGRFINNDQVPMTEGPWYICELQPKVHHCMGGLVTDEKGRVLDVQTDEPIPHLFAAGESTGCVHGAVRLGSVAILDCLVNGRIIGKAVAE